MTTAKVDDRKRIRLPSAKPGQVLAVQENPDGSITLCPIKLDRSDSTTKLKLVRRGRFLMLEGKLSREEISAAIRADREGTN